MAVAKKLYFDVPGMGRLKAFNGSFKPAGVKREGVMTDNGPAGPSEEDTYGELSFKLPNSSGVSGVALGNLKGINVTVQDDLGKTWLCVGAFVTEPPGLSGGEWDVSMQFENQEEIS